MKLYETKSTTNKVFLKNNFFNLRMKEGSTMVDYLNEFNTLSKKLFLIGVNVEDEDKVIIL